MKELVILSGKGGTGKTSLTASFARLALRPVMAATVSSSGGQETAGHWSGRVQISVCSEISRASSTSMPS